MPLASGVRAKSTAPPSDISGQLKDGAKDSRRSGAATPTRQRPQKSTSTANSGSGTSTTRPRAQTAFSSGTRTPVDDSGRSKSLAQAQGCSGASSPLRPRPTKSESSTNLGRQTSQQSKKSIQERHAPVRGGSAASQINRQSARLHTKDEKSPVTGEFASDSSVKVFVRVRPQNTAESKEHQEVVVQTSTACPGTIWLMHPDDQGKEPRTSEHIYDCILPTETTQDRVYELLGEKTVQSVAGGYHGCVFAYGQTGSGKSHTIFGGESNDQRGLMPRIAEGIFASVENSQDESMVTLSYLELYNESPRDLLHPETAGGKDQTPPQLEVRQHPSYGVFVDGLTVNAVESMKDVRRLLDFGNKIRVVGCTNMNASSSRSHAIVTLNVESTITGPAVAGKKKQRAQLHCVDLAGSERLKQAGDSSLRQTESRQINRSLLALNIMITRLAAKHKHIPWRESKLTLLLSEALMGNCRTTVLACVSPSAGSLTSTESTMRFASTVKKIRTKPSKNEEAEGHLIKTLLAEIESLRKQLQDAKDNRKEELNAQLAVTESCCNVVAATWDKRREQSKLMDAKRRQTLTQLGLKSSIDGSVDSQHSVDEGTKIAYLVNECNDTLLSGTLRYSLTLGKQVTIGSGEENNIVLTGLGMRPEMCSVTIVNEKTAEVVLSTSELPCLESWRPVEENGENIFASQQPRTSTTSGSAVRRSADELPCLVSLRSVGENIEEMSASQQPRNSNSEKRTVIHRTTLFRSGIPEVYVNGVLLTHKVQMVDNDLLRIGAVHTYRLRMRLDSHRHCSHVSQVSSSCIVEQESSATRELRVLVNEANMLTEELRGGENVEHEFGIQLLGTAGFSANRAAAQVPVVALSVIERPEDISPEGKPIFSSGGQPCLTAIWSAAKFRERLEMMRDLYDEVRRRDEPWGKPGDIDPWADTLTSVPVKGSAGVDDAKSLPASMQHSADPRRTDLEKPDPASIKPSNAPPVPKTLEPRLSSQSCNSLPKAAPPQSMRQSGEHTRSSNQLSTALEPAGSDTSQVKIVSWQTGSTEEHSLGGSRRTAKKLTKEQSGKIPNKSGIPKEVIKSAELMQRLSNPTLWEPVRTSPGDEPW